MNDIHFLCGLGPSPQRWTVGSCWRAWVPWGFFSPLLFLFSIMIFISIVVGGKSTSRKTKNHKAPGWNPFPFITLHKQWMKGGKKNSHIHPSYKMRPVVPAKPFWWPVVVAAKLHLQSGCDHTEDVYRGSAIGKIQPRLGPRLCQSSVKRNQ